MKRNLLVIIIVLALATMTVGSTIASLSDTEESYDNYVEVGSLDLKVARAGNCEPLQFCDDEPWGTGLFPDGSDGLVPCFAIEENGSFSGPYQCDLTFWNAGCTDGKLFVHFRNVTASPESLISGTTVEIWCDLDNNSVIDTGEVISETLDILDCSSVPLDPVVWILEGNASLDMRITISPPEGSPGNLLEFDIDFELLGGIFVEEDDLIVTKTKGFCDTESCFHNYLLVNEEETVQVIQQVDPVPSEDEEVTPFEFI